MNASLFYNYVYIAFNFLKEIRNKCKIKTEKHLVPLFLHFIYLMYLCKIL